MGDNVDERRVAQKVKEIYREAISKAQVGEEKSERFCAAIRER